MGIGKTLIASTALVATSASVQGAPAWPQAPGYYRMQLGDFRVTVLSDGSVVRDLPAIMTDPDMVRARYHAQHQALPARLSINCYLIDTGDHRIPVSYTHLTLPTICSV